MTFGREEILHLAELSRLALTEEEIERYMTEMPEILEYVGKLSEVDTKDIPPMTGGVAYSTLLREDEVKVSDDETRRALIASFPEHAGDLLKVKAVFAARTEKKTYEGE